MDRTNYLVVGAGVFGASTALHLARTVRHARIILLDRQRPCPSAASSDYNKIIRADYPDITYMELALEAQEMWRSDPIFKPFYHESGMLFAEELGMGRKSFENYLKLRHNSSAEMLTPQEARSRFPVFQDANWTGVKENFYNPQSGWGEGDGAMQSLIEAAIREGVLFEVATVTGLLLDEDRHCKGVCVADGDTTRQILADKTVLCVGAYLAKLLADTAPEYDELQVGGRMMAAAAVQCIATYPPEEEKKLSNAPVHFIGMWHTHGESIPAFNGRLKFNCEVSFTNMTFHEGLKQQLSIPPATESQSTFSQNVPEGLKQEVENVVRNTYGSYVQGIQVESYRMCWDAVSPNQDWIIDYHPKCQNLFIAGAGSFHGWKFMPNIGKYIVQRLLGQLDDMKSQKWAWDRSDSGAACEMYIPERDLKNIGQFNGWSK